MRTEQWTLTVRSNPRGWLETSWLATSWSARTQPVCDAILLTTVDRWQLEGHIDQWRAWLEGELPREVPTNQPELPLYALRRGRLRT